MTTRTFAPNCSISTHIVEASFPRNPRTVRDPKTRLQIAVDEYVIHNASERGITIVLTHGTSFNKKLWGPTISRLLTLLGPQGCVKRILAVDATNHGESWLLNSTRLTNESYWPDQSRDILSVLRYFKAEQPVVGIGHSFGGGVMKVLAHACLMEPASFYATIFIDPILFQMKEQTRNTADRALKRQDKWESLEEVRNAFRRSKGFSDWNPEVLDLHAEYSTVAVEVNGKVVRMLKTPKEQEAATYLAAPYVKLPEILAASTNWHYFVLGGKSIVIPSKDRQWIQTISKPPGRVVIIDEAGHLIPLTHPDVLATQLYDITCEVFARGNKRQQLKLQHRPGASL